MAVYKVQNNFGRWATRKSLAAAKKLAQKDSRAIRGKTCVSQHPDGPLIRWAAGKGKRVCCYVRGKLLKKGR